jgi:hypothetical protein
MCVGLMAISLSMFHYTINFIPVKISFGQTWLLRPSLPPVFCYSRERRRNGRAICPPAVGEEILRPEGGGVRNIVVSNY